MVITESMPYRRLESTRVVQTLFYPPPTKFDIEKKIYYVNNKKYTSRARNRETKLERKREYSRGGRHRQL